jgi:hypothetical protein
MVKTECQKSLSTSSTAQDAEINQIIADVQSTLCGNRNWPFLKSRWDAFLGSGSRYQTFPSTNDVNLACQINLERPADMLVKWNQIWQPVVYGIDEIPEYNYLDSDRNQTLDPIQRWQFDDEYSYEVWPEPASSAQVRFVGQRAPIALALSVLQSSGAGTANANGSWTRAVSLNGVAGTYYINNSSAYIIAQVVNAGVTYWGIMPNGTINYANSLYISPSITGTWVVGPATGNTPVPTLLYQVAWNDGATLDLDDQLISYYTAAEYLTREENPKAPLELQKAQNRMKTLLGAYPTRSDTYCIGRGMPLDRKLIRQVPLVLIAGK